MTDTAQTSRLPVLGFAVALILGAFVLMFLMPSEPLLESGGPAPPFELSKLGTSTKVSLESMRGKVVLVDFWSSTCPPCVRQMDDLEVIHQRLRHAGVAVVGINTERIRPDLLEQFVRQRGVDYTVLLDDDGAIQQRYKVSALPTLYVIDAEGQVRWSHQGFASHRQIESVVRELM